MSIGSVSTSQSSTRQPPRKKSKHTDISGRDFDIETLERELSAAKTKIVTLDTELKDKVQECSALWKRIGIFEERQNSEILDRYFPKHQDPSHSKADGPSSNTDHSGAPPPPASCLCSLQACPCMCHRHPCFMQHSSCHSQFRHHFSPCTETSPKSAISEATIEDVEYLKLQVNHIKDILSNQGNKINDEHGPASSNVPAPTSVPPLTNPDHEVSLASIEEFIVDPFVNPVPSTSDHLNFQYQTDQL